MNHERLIVQRRGMRNGLFDLPQLRHAAAMRRGFLLSLLLLTLLTFWDPLDADVPGDTTLTNASINDSSSCGFQRPDLKTHIPQKVNRSSRYQYIRSPLFTLSFTQR
ncbi:hypothetical protein F5883DRAFT_567869 [Diaporthe sp. PMI_573]|nr:hypothetical protein F5883DRAFT_567869 [Diaporthaceae sp. PMI_573]